MKSSSTLTVLNGLHSHIPGEKNTSSITWLGDGIGFHSRLLNFSLRLSNAKNKLNYAWGLAVGVTASLSSETVQAWCGGPNYAFGKAKGCLEYMGSAFAQPNGSKAIEYIRNNLINGTCGGAAYDERGSVSGLFCATWTGEQATLNIPDGYHYKFDSTLTIGLEALVDDTSCPDLLDKIPCLTELFQNAINFNHVFNTTNSDNDTTDTLKLAGTIAAATAVSLSSLGFCLYAGYKVSQRYFLLKFVQANYPEYICPLTKKIFVHPVVIDDGMTYELSAIQRLQQKGQPCPANIDLPIIKIYPNDNLNSQIKELLECYKNKTEFEIHKYLECSFTLELFEEATIYSDGNTYSFTEMEQWLADNNTSPINRYHIEDGEYLPNHIARMQVLTHGVKFKNLQQDEEKTECDHLVIKINR